MPLADLILGALREGRSAQQYTRPALPGGRRPGNMDRQGAIWEGPTPEEQVERYYTRRKKYDYAPVPADEETAGSTLGGVVGSLAGAGLGRVVRTRGASGGLRPMPAWGGGPQVKALARGGTLRKRREVALVGEEAPELVVKDGDEVRVIPLPYRRTEGPQQPLVVAPTMPYARTLPAGEVAAPLPEVPAYSEPPEDPRLTAAETGTAPLLKVGGVTYTRPSMSDSGDPAADRLAYYENLRDYRNPADRNGRGRSALLSAGLGALQGLATGGGLGAALGGAITGGVRGAVRPNADERVWRDRELGRVSGEIAEDYARRKAEQGLQTQGLDNLYKRAQIAKALRVEPRYFNAGGVEYVIDPETGAARPVPGQNPKGTQPKVLRTVNRAGKVWYETDEGLKPAVDPTTGEQLAEEKKPMREVTLGGETFQVPEEEAARIFGSIEAANVASGNTYTRESHEDAVREAERRGKTAEQQWEDARRGVEEANALLSDIRKNEARKVAIEQMPPKERAEAAAEYKEIAARLQQQEAAFRERGKSLIDRGARQRADGSLELGDRPAPPPVPRRPAPQPRQSPRAGSAPRRGGKYVPPRVRRSDLEALLGN